MAENDDSKDPAFRPLPLPADEARERVRRKIDATLKDNERLRARVTELEAELAEARRIAAESEELRSAVAQSAVDASGSVVRALDEVIHLKKVVDAAIAMWGALSLPRDQYLVVEAAFNKVVEVELERVGGRS